MDSNPPTQRRELAEWCRRRLINHYHPDKPTGDHVIAQEINAASNDDDAIISLALKYKFIARRQVPKKRRRKTEPPSMLEAVRQHAVSGQHNFSDGLAHVLNTMKKQPRRRFNIIWKGLAYMEQEPLGIPPSALTEPVTAVVLKFEKADLAVYCEKSDIEEVKRRCVKLQRDITDREKYQFG